MSSAMSAAKAASDHMRDWFKGTSPNKFVSMGVLSDGSYGAPKDVIFSFPVTIKNGKVPHYYIRFRIIFLFQIPLEQLDIFIYST